MREKETASAKQLYTLTEFSHLIFFGKRIDFSWIMKLANVHYTKACTNSRPPGYSLALKSDGLRQTANNGKSNGRKLNSKWVYLVVSKHSCAYVITSLHGLTPYRHPTHDDVKTYSYLTIHISPYIKIKHTHILNSKRILLQAERFLPENRSPWVEIFFQGDYGEFETDEVISLSLLSSSFKTSHSRLKAHPSFFP